MVLFDQEFGKEFYSDTKSIIKPGLFDHLSLFIRRNSKHCDISGRSDRLITDTSFTLPACCVVKPANIFWHHLGLVECFYLHGWCHGVRLHLRLKSSMLEFFQLIINYINLSRMAGNWRINIHLFYGQHCAMGCFYFYFLLPRPYF